MSTTTQLYCVEFTYYRKIKLFPHITVNEVLHCPDKVAKPLTYTELMEYLILIGVDLFIGWGML